MAFIDGTIANVAAPKFQAAFHASVVDVQWVIESYGLFLSSLILIGARSGIVGPSIACSIEARDISSAGSRRVA